MKRTNDDHRILKGLLAGAIAGLAGAWFMNQFQSGLSKVESAWEKSAHRAQLPKQNMDQDAEDATMKTADRVVTMITHRHLTREQKKKAGPIVHYGYGALIGGVYGALAEVTPIVTSYAGTAYGAAAWLAGDEIAVPKLGLSEPPSKYPPKVHIEALAAHLAYGLGTDLVRRGVRAAL
jgi:putative membrane protein